MESALYGINALVVFVSEIFTRSLRSLVRFLIRQRLVRKYSTPALSTLRFVKELQRPHIKTNHLI